MQEDCNYINFNFFKLIFIPNQVEKFNHSLAQLKLTKFLNKKLHTSLIFL